MSATKTIETLFICGSCSGQTALGQRHVCIDNRTARERKIQAAAAEQLANRLKADRTPEPCRDCKQPMPPGTGHLCSYVDPKFRNGAADAIAAQLRAAGYKVDATV